MRELFDAISKVKSPKMIYAILTAGFSVFDLGTIFKTNNNIKAYIMLTNMLPNLTHEQIESIEALNDENTPVCVYTKEVARIPINGLGVHYDLHSIFNALNKVIRQDNNNVN